MVIKHRVPKISRKLKLKESVTKVLEDALLAQNNKTYLWLYVVLNNLEETVGRTTDKSIQKFCATIPKNVEESYEKILSQSHEPETARTLLYLILGAARPLTVSELNTAFACVDHVNSWEEVDMEEDENFLITLRNSCGLLVTVIGPSVYFLHQSVKDFLLCTSMSNASNFFWKNMFEIITSHKILSKVCITYLQGQNFEAGSDRKILSVHELMSTNLFLHYAASHWGDHVLQAREEDSVVDSALSVLQDDTFVLLCSQLLWFKFTFAHDKSYFDEWRNTGMHIVACFGLVKVMARMLQADTQPAADSKNALGRTPLFYAAYNGHEAIVKLLIARSDVNVVSEDIDCCTPLSYAASNGHETIVRTFLARNEVKADSKDHLGQTPLSKAARRGHEAVVRLLLSRDDAGADAEDSLGATPLLVAAREGHEVIVRLLLACEDVKVDSEDAWGRTPISYAARAGYFAIVKLLLQAGAVADSKDRRGQTPFSHAAETGREDLIQLFLTRSDIDANSKDQYGRTPISYAAGSGTEASIKLLFGHNIQAEYKDNHGRTPLSYAARSGREAIVKLLLEYYVEADCKDNYGRTPLSFAVESGSEAVVKLLLKCDIDADYKDVDGRTPLSRASSVGSTGIAELLLMRSDINADSKDGAGRTPLWHAAASWNEGVVELLLAHIVDAESEDIHGETPLSCALRGGYYGVVILLVNRISRVANPKRPKELSRALVYLKESHPMENSDAGSACG